MFRYPERQGTQDTSVDTLAAELAVAAYRVALRARDGGTWLDLELELWKSLADKLNTMSRF